MDHHPAFLHQRSHQIESLNLNIDEYEHIKTGAKHFHLAMPHPENVFMVALRTVPMDSKGVAHILEHTALCGSEQYPVRDPFFLMIRRSLNTFMNAFTTSDYTAYPFASQNDQDFDNLLDIYLDAVFFSRLDELDFAQEGHRVEFETADDPSTDLVYRGVVYNEMKGDTSSIVSVLYDAVKKHLFPTTTYHYNSGGDPAHIPDLSYKELVDFYQSHYHPSNAIFMTFGERSAAELQARFEEKALARFEKSDHLIEVAREERYLATLRVEEPYAIEPADADSKKSHVVMGWLLGDNTDLELLLKCNLLSDVLLDTSASPLRKALENTDLGVAPSPLCGLEETNREMSFMCGLEGADQADADAIEALILETLTKVANEGVAIEKLEACLHQLELSQREVGGDGYPYGLQLIFSCMSAAIHRGDPIELLDIDPVLEKLRLDIQSPAFIKDIIQELLLDNKHQIRLTLFPDAELGAEKEQAEKDKLAAIKAAMSEAEQQNVVTLAADLEARQNREEPIDVLPKVGLKDIPHDIKTITGDVEVLDNGLSLSSFEASTNGIVYHQVITELPALSAQQLSYLPLYSQLVTELGAGNSDYLETQHQQHSLTGGVSAFAAVRGELSDPNSIQAYITYSSKSLAHNTQAMTEILKQVYEVPRFDELSRIRDLVKQTRVRRENSIPNSGHSLAMSAAASYFRPVSKLNHHLSGLSGIEAIKKLDDSLDDAEQLKQFAKDLANINTQIRANQPQLLVVADGSSIGEAQSQLKSIWRPSDGQVPASKLNPEFGPGLKDQAWVTATQVNFCASAYATVSESHADTAALNVLAGVLRNGFLHRVIREQGGAYGGGAGHDSANGVFRFYSYRDPNLMSTFQAFTDAVDWILNIEISFDLVEESILGIISSMDAPASPAGEARQVFHGELFGRSQAHKKIARANILAVTVPDIKKVARKYLLAEHARAVVMSEKYVSELDDSFVIHHI